MNIVKFNELVDILLIKIEMLSNFDPPEEKKKTGGGRRAKNKGKRGEREAAKFFGELLFNDPDAFVKSPASGAWVWAGDISPNPKKDYDFKKCKICVEVKNDERFSLDEFIGMKGLSEKSFMAKTVKQLVRENPKDHLPFLYMTRNHKAAIVGIRKRDNNMEDINPSWWMEFELFNEIWQIFLANEFKEMF